MTWSTKTFGRDKEYIVIKHRLNDINGTINGVKFRSGYAVVEKNSKAYFQLKQLPLIKGQPELPLSHLRKLKFITRTKDIQLVYGQDVYYHYLKAVETIKEEIKPVVQKVLKKEEPKVVKKVVEEVLSANVEEAKIPCAYLPKTGKPCSFDALELSPSGYCKMHLLKDPALKSLGIIVPEKVGRGEVKELNEKVLTELKNLSNP